MPTTIDSAGITFNDATSLTSAVIPANAVGATQIANGSVTAAKLGTNERKQIAKAWVNFTDPTTIRSSYNVSSVTKNGTGDFEINFANPMTDANYAVSISAQAQAVTAITSIDTGLNNRLTINNAPIRMIDFNGNLINPVTACIIVFGN